MNGKRKVAIVLAMVLLMTVALVLPACEPTNKLIDHLEMYTLPKTEYVAGQSLDLSGAQVLVVYDNDEELLVAVDASMVSEFEPYRVGTQILTVTYQGYSTGFSVTVRQADIQHPDLTAPRKLEYIQGTNLELDGGSITVYFANTTSLTLPLDDPRVRCEGYDRERVGNQRILVTVEIDGQVTQAEFYVTVVAKTLTGISVHRQPDKTKYYAGEELDLTGGELWFNYDNGYHDTFSMQQARDEKGVQFSWDNSRVTVVSKVTVLYTETVDEHGTQREFTDGFNVSILERDIVGFELLGTIPEQILEQDLDFGDVRARITYNNDEVEEVLLSDPTRFRLVGEYDNQTPGPQTLQLHFYTGEYLNPDALGLLRVTVTVVDKYLDHFVVVHPEGEVLYEDTDLRSQIVDVWQIYGVYSNGTVTPTETLTAAMVDHQESEGVYYYDDPGEYAIRIVYLGMHGTEAFRVQPLTVVVDECALLGAERVIVTQGESLDLSGVRLHLVYANGTSEDVDVTPEMVEGFSDATPGAVDVLVRYANAYTAYTHPDGITLPMTVIVVRVVQSIELVSPLTNTDYALGTTFSTDGLCVRLNYSDDTHEDVSAFSGDWVFTSDAWDDDATRVFTHLTDVVNDALQGSFPVSVRYIGQPEGQPALPIGEIVVHNYLVSIDADDVQVPEFVVGTQPDYRGLTFVATYEDGSTRDVALDDPNVNNPFDYKTWTGVGVTYVTISYNDPEDGSAVEPPTSQLTLQTRDALPVGISIAVRPGARTLYGDGDTSDTVRSEMAAGFILVYLNFDNGAQQAVDPDAVDIDEVREVGNHKGVFTFHYTTSIQGAYETLSADFTVDLEDDNLIVKVEWVGGDGPTINVPQGTVLDNLQTVFANESYTWLVDLKNASIQRTYQDGHTDSTDVDGLAAEMAIIGYSADGSDQYPSLRYQGFELRFTVNMQPRKLRTISVEGAEGLQVVQGAKLDPVGVRLVLHYNNGTTTEIQLLEKYFLYDAVSNPGGYDQNDQTVGRGRRVTVKYTDVRDADGKYATTEFYVNVVQKQLLGISIQTLPKTQYVEHEPFDITGGKIAAVYDNDQTEIIDLTEDAVGAINAKLYVNVSAFSSEEFTGESKLQTIWISYRDDAGNTCMTSYDVLMRDRLDPRVEATGLWQDDVFTSTYGESLADKFGFQITISGSIDDAEPSTRLEVGAYKVEYVPYDSRFDRDPDGDKYTALPKNAGTYAVIISYAGDAVNNGVENMQYRIVIARRAITVAIESVTKIYGTANPEYHLVIPAGSFAEGDGFTTSTFADQSVRYDTPAYYDGQEIRLFEILANENSGSPIGNGTGVGTYRITVRGVTSLNYDVHYATFDEAYRTEGGNVYYNRFEITKRQVSVTPNKQFLTRVYGEPTGQIPFDAGQVYDAEGNAVPDSGLYDIDTLAGTLRREQDVGASDYSPNVGNYRITLGSLSSSNPNYAVSFRYGTTNGAISYALDPEKLGDADPYLYVQILPRDLYLAATNTTVVYGDELPPLGVRASADSAGRDLNAFAYDETLEVLGAVRFDVTGYREGERLAVGDYVVHALVGEGVVNPDTPEILNNYRVFYIVGVLRVTPRPVQVYAEAAQKEFGSPDPETLAFRVEGLSGNPSSGLVEGEQLAGALVRDSGENVGNFAIRVGDLVASNPNYAITYVYAMFRIYARVITLTLAQEGLGKVYDGRLPAIEETYFTFADSTGAPVEGEEVEAIQNAFTLVFAAASKNAGLYAISLRNEGSNYNVRLANADYSYSITQREVEVRYDGLPDNEEYRGSVGYTFSAYVPEEDIQYIYNDDGTVRTGPDGKDLRDDVQVTLSTMFAANAGTYTTRPLSLSNTNYRLAESEANAERSFTILARTVTIRLKLPEGEFNLERGYNGQVAEVLPSQYDIENAIPGEPVGFTLTVTDQFGAPPKDVQYDETGAIAPYRIGVVQTSGANYRVVLASDHYGYVIVPAAVTISIHTGLSKAYNGNEPSLNTTDWSKAGDYALAQNLVRFGFVRKEGDTRSNSSVGRYQVMVYCDDPNHTVSLDREYEYTITKATVSFTINPNANRKTYDPLISAGFSYNQLTFPASYPGRSTPPYVRNFASMAQYTNFTADMEEMVASATTLYRETLNLSDGDLSQLMVQAAKSALERFWDTFTRLGVSGVENRSLLSESTLLTIGEKPQEGGAGSGEYALLLAALDAADAVAAQQHAQSLLQALELENSYLVFIFTPVEDTTATVDLIGAGQYTYQFIGTDNDYNRNYRLANGTYQYTIDQWAIRIESTDTTTVYGRTQKVQSYAFITTDVATSDILYYEDPVAREQIKRISRAEAEAHGIFAPPEGYDAATQGEWQFLYHPIVEGDLVRLKADGTRPGTDEAGNYVYDDDRDYVPNDYRVELSSAISTDKNYRVANTTYSVVHHILRATIHVQLPTIDVDEDGNPVFVYGSPIEVTAVKGKYTYTQSDIVGPYEGYTGEVNVSINDDGSIYRALYNTNVNIFESGGVTIPAGEYELTVNTFSAGGNFTFEIAPGVVVVHKAPLTLQLSDGNLTRLYGDESVFQLTFEGLASGDDVWAALAGSGLEPRKMPKLAVDETLTSDADTYQASADVGVYNGLHFRVTSGETHTVMHVLGDEVVPLVLNNYDVLVGDNNFNVRVMPAPLTLQVLSNTGVDDVLELTYGDEPTINRDLGFVVNNEANPEDGTGASYVGSTAPGTYRLVINGYKNGQHATDFLDRDGKPLVPSIDLHQIKVRESDAPIDSMRLYGEGNAYMQSFTEAMYNYDITWLNTTLRVTPATLQVSLNKDINMIYDPENPSAPISEYKATYDLKAVKDNGEITSYYTTAITITGGYYHSYWDFQFVGLKYGEQPGDLFRRKLSEMQNIESYGMSSDQDTTQSAGNAFEEHLSYMHNIVEMSARKVGKNEIHLANMALVDDVPNYTLVYPNTTLNLFAISSELIESDQQVLLEGDSVEALQVGVVDQTHTDESSQNGVTMMNVTAENGFTVNGSFNSSAMGDDEGPRTLNVSYQTQSTPTTYRVPSTVTRGTRPDGGEQIPNEVSVTKNIQNETASSTVSGDIHYWIYAKQTKTVNDAAEWESAINATGGTEQVLHTYTGLNMDGVELLVRMQRTAPSSAFRLVINGTPGSTRYLALEYYDNLLCLVVHEADGAVAEDAIGDQRRPLVINVLSRASSLFNLFDGNYHRIVVRFNRLNVQAYVEVDGMTDGFVSLTYDAGGELRDLYADPQVTSAPSLSFTNVKGQVREARLLRQGYHDNDATLVTPAVSQGMSELAVLYYDAATDPGMQESELSIDLQQYFRPNVYRAGYVYRYYVNGRNVYTVDMTGGERSTTGEADYAVSRGFYLLELAVYDGSELFSAMRYYLQVTPRARATTVQVTDSNASESAVQEATLGSDPVSLYGYAYDAGTPGVYTNSSPKTVRHNILLPTSFNTYRSIAYDFTYTAALDSRGYRRQDQVETLLVLWYNNGSSGAPNQAGATGDYGLALGITHRRFQNNSGAAGAYYTNLYALIGGQVYTTALNDGGIAWEAGADGSGVMTVEAYADPDSGMLVVRILRDGAQVLESVVNSSTQFSEGRISDAELYNLFGNDGGRIDSPAILAQDSRIDLIGVRFNNDAAASFVPGYLVNNAYREAEDGSVTLSAGDWLTRAGVSPTGYTQALGVGSAAYLSFASLASGGTFTWYLAYTEHSSAASADPAGNGLCLVYKEGALYFRFYVGATVYRDQLLGSYALDDGGEHTIRVQFESGIASTADLGLDARGILAAGSAETICKRVHVWVDDAPTEQDGFYAPYYRQVYNWVSANGDSVQGGTVVTRLGEAMFSANGYYFDRLVLDAGAITVTAYGRNSGSVPTTDSAVAAPTI